MSRLAWFLAVCCLLAVLAVPAWGHDEHATGSSVHREMNGVVAKIASGFIFAMPAEGLRPRTFSPNKADRAGLHEAKPGDVLTLVVDEGNILLDAHKTGVPPAGHRWMKGTLDYADAFWQEVRLAAPDGHERFDVDALAGSKLSVLHEGASVVIEIDEDNRLIDIHRLR